VPLKDRLTGNGKVFAPRARKPVKQTRSAQITGKAAPAIIQKRLRKWGMPAMFRLYIPSLTPVTGLPSMHPPTVCAKKGKFSRF
jgi:hypothetical protein